MTAICGRRVGGFAAWVIVPLVVGGVVTAPGRAVANGQTAAAEVTFTKHVLPIMQRACQQCHRPGSVAPMSLLTYEEVRPWARAIRDRTAQREMPPWYIERNVGVRTFKEDASLTDEEIATIGKWVDAGAPRGNPADAPPPVQLASLEEWRIGTPEWIVELPEAQTIGAVDADRWFDVWADSRLTQDRYIKAVETKPSAGAYRVVHHVATSMRW
jgi:mono/diheme cytochrome c family protein